MAVRGRELTPLVSLELPDSLLLEVQGSLKLFGGVAAVKQILTGQLDKQRIDCSLCAAPTPLAALWLARHAEADVLEPSALPARLSALPLEVTRWPDATRALLADMGVRTVGDCLRLPRDGFARRIGVDYLRELDKALGRQPDLRHELGTEPASGGTIELPAESTETEVFAKALERIVTDLATDLRRRQRQVQDLRVVFQHARRPATLSRLQLVEPTHEVRRLLDPLLARLESLVLPAPVIAIGLHADSSTAMRIDASELFAGANASGQMPASEAALVESLRGRFGSERVYGLELMIEHRPERVWAKLTGRVLQRASNAARLSPHACDRPLWILPAPLPLAGKAPAAFFVAERDADAVEPERIECGWWDGDDVSRDYYAVTTVSGQRLWIYQDCATSAWYLHGIFG